MLRFYVAVARELHFGRAAQHLGIDQAAVSRTISRFERQVGVRLLDRAKLGPVRITHAGETMLAGAVELIARYDALIDEARDAALDSRP